MQDFSKLVVWQKARELVMQTYLAAKKLPPSERFNLSSQMTRAAVSISANIAEGAGQNSPAQFNRFLSMAYGSASELHSLLILCADLGYVTQGEIDYIVSALSRVQRMLRALQQKVGGAAAVDIDP